MCKKKIVKKLQLFRIATRKVKVTFYNFFILACNENLNNIWSFMWAAYILKIASKSIKITMSYKRLTKIAVLYDFRPIAVINLYFCPSLDFYEIFNMYITDITL